MTQHIGSTAHGVKYDVIFTQGMGSKDMVVWHLLHIDTAVDRVIEQFSLNKKIDRLFITNKISKH